MEPMEAIRFKLEFSIYLTKLQQKLSSDGVNLIENSIVICEWFYIEGIMVARL